jgi:hypothetical protein
LVRFRPLRRRTAAALKPTCLTTREGLAVAETKNYVNWSRLTHSAALVTDAAARALRMLAQNSGQKSVALDHVRESGIVAALKRAHADLSILNASPLSTADELTRAVAPATQYDRQLSRLAFLAPELQRDILTGAQPRGLALRPILKNEMPLAWADQKNWIDRHGF